MTIKQAPLANVRGFNPMNQIDIELLRALFYAGYSSFSQVLQHAKAKSMTRNELLNFLKSQA